MSQQEAGSIHAPVKCKTPLAVAISLMPQNGILTHQPRMEAAECCTQHTIQLEERFTAWMLKSCMAPPTVLQEGLFIGAAATQASLIDYLLDASSAASKKHQHQTNGHNGHLDNGHHEKPQGGMASVYTALAHHLQRIAGNPVSAVVHRVMMTAAVPTAACATMFAAQPHLAGPCSLL